MGVGVNGKLIKKKRLKKFEILFNEISDALFLHDFEGNILKVNESACARLGYSKDEFKLMNLKDFSSNDILKNWESRIAVIRKSGKFSFETIYFSKDRQQLDVEIVSKIIKIDSRELVLSSARDITKRKSYEKQLVELQQMTEENEIELKTIFNKAPSTMILFDDDAKILRINQKGILKFNVDESNFTDQRIGDVINCVNTLTHKANCGFTDSCVKCQLLKILNDTILYNTEYKKKEITIEILEQGIVVKKTMLVSTSFLTKNGKNTYLATIDDITSRKQMELELLAAKEKAEESERLKTAFLNNISHEIRTPLNGILGFLDFFDDEYYHFSKEEKQHFITTMRKSGERLINTITDLVEVSKLDCGILTHYKDKVELYDELRVFAEEQKGRLENPNIIFDHDIDKSLKGQRIVIDKSKLFQILKNLVNNAYKFTSYGKVKLTVKTEENNLIFSVSDTGIGIDPKYKDCIYEPFRQAEVTLDKVYEGTGLGLTISKKLVDKFGGDIWFESTPGEGTTFYVSLPYVPVEKPHIYTKNPTGKSSTRLKLAGKKILVVEDELSNYLFLDAVLGKQECHLVHALNGKEALDVYTRDPNFDIIIMDLQMPVMDGFEATLKIKEINRHVPIVAYSAYVLEDEKQKAIKAGCIDFLSKPVGKEEVLTKLEKYLNPLKDDFSENMQ